MKKLLTAAFICTTVFLLSCNSTDTSNPKSVLMSFFDALGKKDISAARKLATAESKSMLDMMEMGMKMGGANKKDEKYKKENMEFGEATIEGDKATVPVKDKTSGETTNYTLKKEGGGWKVAFDKSSMMNMGADKVKEHGADMDSSIENGLDKLKNTNMDSLNNKLKESLDKLDDATKKLNQNNN
jgi:hypothetical protein